MTYEQAKQMAATLHAEVLRAGTVLNTFSREVDVKHLAAYQRARTEFQFAFAKLRAFNEYFVRKHGERRRAEYRARRAV